MSVAELGLSQDWFDDYRFCLSEWCEKRWTHLKAPLNTSFSGHISQRYSDRFFELAERVALFIPLIFATIADHIAGGLGCIINRCSSLNGATKSVHRKLSSIIDRVDFLKGKKWNISRLDSFSNENFVLERGRKKY